MLLLPETRGVPLPDTIDDIEFPDRQVSITQMIKLVASLPTFSQYADDAALSLRAQEQPLFADISNIQTAPLFCFRVMFF